MMFLFSLLLIWQVQPQTVTLEQVISAANTVADFEQDYASSDKMYSQSTEAVDLNWYPQLQLSGEISYQSDVPSVPVSIPGASVPAAPKDRYRLNLNVQQLIWDGGRTASERENLKIDQRLRDLDLLKARDERVRRVRKIYFSIVKARVQIKQLENTLSTLEERVKEIQIAVEAGAALSLKKNQIKAEQISLLQQKKQIERRLEGDLQNLAKLTQLDLSKEDVFKLPEPIRNTTAKAESNTQIKYLTQQQKSILQQKNLISPDLKPKVTAFGTVGYANPGLNMFEDNFSEYAVGGISMSWNIWDWGKTKHRKAVISHQAKLIDQQKRRTSDQIETLIHEIEVAISALDEIIEEDEQIIQLRNEILNQIESQWKAGAQTSAEYVEALNKLQQAHLSKELHHIQQSELTQEILWITGKAY
jgi:outer membrane protein TolC